MTDHIQELKKITDKSAAAILYKPFSDEVDYALPSFPLKICPNRFFLPADAKSDPFFLARKLVIECRDSNPYVLIPGMKFDIYGTRRGRGGGWYDRFLSAIPAEWVRIGVAFAEQVSVHPIPRESWDEPVDWILACDGTVWRAYRCRTRRI